jgi:hypothetical protein
MSTCKVTLKVTLTNKAEREWVMAITNEKEYDGLAALGNLMNKDDFNLGVNYAGAARVSRDIERSFSTRYFAWLVLGIIKGIMALRNGVKVD